MRAGRAIGAGAGAAITVAVAMVALASVPAVAAAPQTARGVTTRVPLTSVAPARGVDVSSFQHPGGAAITWKSVAGAGFRFAFIKSTEGSYYVNPYFRTDAAAAKAAGLLVAAYHFANPANSSGTRQADFMLNHGAYHADGRTLRPILDIERDPYLTRPCYGLSPSGMVSWISAFMAEVHRRSGLWPVINTQPAWWDKCTGRSGAFAADQLWVQDPSTTVTSPQLPSGWTRWAYWQYSITAKVPGITGNTDLNRLNPRLLAVADPGNQSYPVSDQIRVQVRSVNKAAGQALSYIATGLPSGLTVNPTTGVITGTLPASAGSTSVTLTASAAGAAPITWHFAWYVHGKATLTAPAAQAGQVGSTVRLQVKAQDGLAGCTLRFTASGLPPGLSISSCGLITGRPTRVGTYQPVIRVTDSTAAILASAAVTWKVT